MQKTPRHTRSSQSPWRPWAQWMSLRTVSLKTLAEEFVMSLMTLAKYFLFSSGSQSPFNASMQLSIVRHLFCTTIRTSSHSTFVARRFRPLAIPHLLLVFLLFLTPGICTTGGRKILVIAVIIIMRHSAECMPKPTMDCHLTNGNENE